MLRFLLVAFLLGVVSLLLLAPDSAEETAVDMPVAEQAPPAGSATKLEPVRRDIRNVTPPGAVRLPSVETTRVERLPARSQPPPPRRPAKLIEWPLPVVETAGHFVSRGVTVELADIRTLLAEAVCAANDGRNWPCGRYARAALRRLVRNRTISCDAPAAAEGEKRIMRRCEIAGQDLAGWLADRGWADAPPDSRYHDLAAAARKAGRGMWSTETPD